jgi:hypothetical protein
MPKLRTGAPVAASFKPCRVLKCRLSALDRRQHLRECASRHKRPFTRVPIFTVRQYKDKRHKDKRPRGHYTAWPLRDHPPRPSRDSVSGRKVCGWRCLSRMRWNYPLFRRTNTPQPTRPLQTASLATFRGDALTDLLAGLAANSIGSFVKGFTPLRASVAGLFTTDILAKPGMTNSPDSFSSL